MDEKNIQECFESLRHLETIYPGFENWFWYKVKPGLENGTRFLLSKKLGDEIVGVVIAKKVERETPKICTLWVDKRYRKRGFGVRLLISALEWLNDHQPELSISESNMAEFSHLIEKFEFKLTSSSVNLQTGKKEFHFNERK